MQVIHKGDDIEYTLLVEQKKVEKYLCPVVMAGLGGAIAVVALPATMGASIGFSIIWSLITDRVC